MQTLLRFNLAVCTTLWPPGIILCEDSSTTMSQGNLYSTNYPNAYGDNRNCTLTFYFDTAIFPSGAVKSVALDVQILRLEGGYDYFHVIDDVEKHSYTGKLDNVIYYCT